MSRSGSGGGATKPAQVATGFSNCLSRGWPGKVCSCAQVNSASGRPFYPLSSFSVVATSAAAAAAAIQPQPAPMLLRLQQQQQLTNRAATVSTPVALLHRFTIACNGALKSNSQTTPIAWVFEFIQSNPIGSDPLSATAAAAAIHSAYLPALLSPMLS